MYQKSFISHKDTFHLHHNSENNLQAKCNVTHYNNLNYTNFFPPDNFNTYYLSQKRLFIKTNT